MKSTSNTKTTTAKTTPDLHDLAVNSPYFTIPGARAFNPYIPRSNPRVEALKRKATPTVQPDGYQTQ